MTDGDRRQALNGLSLMILAMLLLPGIDAIAKLLSATIPPLQVTWGRFFFQVLLMAPLVVATGGWRSLWPNRFWGNALRGILIAAASLFFFTAVKYMPLADTYAIFFMEPMILTVLSAVLLKEQVGWRRGAAVIVGFCGALIVIRPSFAAVGPVALLPAAAALSFAFYLILTRSLTRYDSALTMQFAAGVAGMLFLSVCLTIGHAFDIEAASPQPAALEVWSLLLLIGVLATTGHLMVVAAFQRLPASALAGFQYLEIVSGTVLGFWLFGDFPDLTTWTGVAIIVGSGLYIFWREGRVRSVGR